jgi:hypothetical protein
VVWWFGVQARAAVVVVATGGGGREGRPGAGAEAGAGDSPTMPNAVRVRRGQAGGRGDLGSLGFMFMPVKVERGLVVPQRCTGWCGRACCAAEGGAEGGGGEGGDADTPPPPFRHRGGEEGVRGSSVAWP